MKSTKLYLWIGLAAAACLAISENGLAQDWSTALSYQISLPGGDTKNFTGETSFRGIGLDLRKEIAPATTAGLFFGWHVFYERIDETIQIQTENPGAITGMQDRFLNSFPIMLSLQRFFGKAGGIQPFLGLNAGGFIILQEIGFGVSVFENDEWQWGGAPELGVVVPIDRDVSIIISGKYNYAFTGESVLGTDINNSYWTLGIGFAWEGY
jgi:hypothetical protein